MQSITIQRAMVLAVCIAITPIQTNAAQSKAVAWDDLPATVAMGPDPGGKTGAGVTSQTTRTDHPAAGGPQSPAKPDSATGRLSESALRDESTQLLGAMRSALAQTVDTFDVNGVEWKEARELLARISRSRAQLKVDSFRQAHFGIKPRRSWQEGVVRYLPLEQSLRSIGDVRRPTNLTAAAARIEGQVGGNVLPFARLRHSRGKGGVAGH